ncbi:MULTISPECIES: family 1 encapsulin nanocompartment shell protein [unclassified Pelosinus]|uniref:family 1 encapsulin nanocompartment shell protein n=1 Tax=unclassified Pelosinus TaxID=2629460 RepID=UPI0004D0C582|nr:MULTISPECIES: family 1 encapsulin nanocompartment shell protein [unclassified Pelosinus]AIF53674.1 Linocin M18 bacteriocin protein [Pelosinus sp. UFO1]GMB01674.1 bacteriocin [Pelosinus sp. IPA-1]
MDILDRDSAPLTEAEWSKIDEAVVTTARRMLVGRKVIEVLGPMGPGVYTIPYSVFSGTSSTGIDMVGEQDDFIVAPSSRATTSVPMLYKDFKIMWRDVEADRHMGLPLDVSTAAVAANYVAVQEDNLIFNGNKELGQVGLMNVQGRKTVKISNWDEPGSALADAVKAVSALSEAGHYGPYAMVVSPVLFGRMVRVYGNTGMLELDQVKALISGGVYYSNTISGNKAVVLATGGHNVNLAVGQDMTTSYMGPTNMNHVFRVLETTALLVRRPDAICTIE